MNRQILWRIVWKEHRQQGGFAVAVVLLTLAAQGAALCLGRGSPASVPEQFYVGAAFVAVALYALGCGAMLFALELERQTCGFQQSFPVSPHGVFVGKLCYAACSTLVVALVLGLALAVLSILGAGGSFGITAVGYGTFSIARGGILLVVELLAWGVFFSLRTPVVVTALLSGATAAFLSGAVVPRLLGWFWHGMVLNQAVAAESTAAGLGLWVRGGVLICVLIADGWLGRRWLREPSRAPRPLKERQSRARARWFQIPGVRTTGSRRLDRLLWQNVRQSRSLWSAVGFLTAGILLWSVLYYLPLYRDTQVEFIPRVALALIPAALIGAMVFHADQVGRSYRFLSERGTSYELHWFSRQVVGVGLLCIWTIVLLLSDIWPKGAWSLAPANTLAGYLHNMTVIPLCLITAYSAGQFCSQWFRSGPLAVVFGLTLAALLWGWAWLMYMLRIPVIWSVVPIPALLLWLTYRQMGNWLRERDGLSARLRAAGWLLGLFALLAAAVPLFRAYELPRVDAPQGTHQPVLSSSPEALVTGRMFREANWAHVSFPGRSAMKWNDPQQLRAWLDKNQEALELASRAASRPARSFPRDGTPEGRGPSLQLGILTLVSGADARRSGELDRALERYLTTLRMALHARYVFPRRWAVTSGDMLGTWTYRELVLWAAHPQQTMPRLEQAVAQVEACIQAVPSPVEGVVYDYAVIMRSLTANTGDTGDAVAFFVETQNQGFFLFVSRFMPWELVRAQRIVGRGRNRELAHWQRVQREIEAGQGVNPESEWMRDAWRLSIVDPLQAALLGRMLHEPIDMTRPTKGEITVTSHRRSWGLAMALHRWRIAHGDLPGAPDLSSLASDWPLDARTGNPIVYAPQGWTGPLREQLPAPVLTSTVQWPVSSVATAPEARFIGDTTPFLWSHSTGYVLLSPAPTQEAK